MRHQNMVRRRDTTVVLEIVLSVLSGSVVIEYPGYCSTLLRVVRTSTISRASRESENRAHYSTA